MGFLSFEKRERKNNWNMIKLESHPYFEIYFLREGTRNVIIKDTYLTLTAPSAIIIPPFTAHRTEGGPYSRHNIYVSPELLDKDTVDFLSESQPPLYFLLEDEAEYIFRLLTDAQSINNDKTKSVSIYKNSFLYSILFYLKKCKIKEIEKAKKGTRKIDLLILDVVNYLNSHYNEDISLDFLCKHFFISKSSLCRRFKKVMKCTVYDYILFIRFNKAKQMLFDTNKDIQTIASDCGFSSLNYFSLLFKKKTGITPSQFRKSR